MGDIFIIFILFGIASIIIGLAQLFFQIWAHFSLRHALNRETRGTSRFQCNFGYMLCVKT